MSTPVGPSESFGQQMRKLREQQGLTQQQLADRLAGLGYSMSRSTVAKVESSVQERGVTLADVLAVAAVLNASPTWLVVPDIDDADMAVTPQLVASAWRVRGWLYGRGPVTDDADVSDFLRKRPHAEQVSALVESHPAVVAVNNLVVALRRAVIRTEGVTPDVLVKDIRTYGDEATGYVELMLRSLTREADERADDQDDE